MHVDLIAEGFNVALRSGVIEDTSLVSRILATNTQIADIALYIPQTLPSAAHRRQTTA